MKDTKIVFIGIAVLAVLPILFQGAKHIWYAFKGESKKYLWMRLLAVVITAFAVVLLVVSLYRFTIGYQAPLVAEQFHNIFIKRMNETTNQDEYLIELQRRDLVAAGFDYIENEEIEKANLVPGEYSVALSENIYDNDDGTITLYARYRQGDEEFFTAIRLNMEDNRWRAVEHKILAEEELDEAGLQKRFYEIEIGS